MAAGLYLFGCRDPIGLRLGPCPATRLSNGSGLYALERSLIAASAVATAIGLGLIAELTRGTAGFVPAKVGASLFKFGAFLIVVVEVASAGAGAIPGQRALIIGYVVLAFLGQAGTGWGLIGGLGLRVIGWLTVVFNLGLLIALLIFSPHDMYFPVAHVLMPAVIAIALLVRTRLRHNRDISVR